MFLAIPCYIWNSCCEKTWLNVLSQNVLTHLILHMYICVMYFIHIFPQKNFWQDWNISSASCLVAIVCAHSKCKVFPYSMGLELIQVYRHVSPQVTWPDGRLPWLSARPAVTSIEFTRWCHMVSHIWFQLTIYLSTLKGWKAKCACWLTCSGWFTNSSCHPSAAG